MSIAAHRSKGVMGMTESRWLLMGITAALLAALLGVSLSSSPSGRFYRWTRRAFWAAALLIVSGGAGGIGLNACTFAAVLGLGLPGYAALMVISAL